MHQETHWGNSEFVDLVVVVVVVVNAAREDNDFDFFRLQLLLLNI